MNSVDYVVLMYLFGTVDDTVMLTKTVLQEILPEAGTLACDKYGKKVLLWLMRPKDKRLFSPYELSCTAVASVTSMKSAETRERELARAALPRIREVLLEQGLAAAADVNAKDVLLTFMGESWDAALVEALLAAAE